ncbi:hypothetical protein FD723_05570 [Nostoc sp. C052]|uniref:hypothetical protein n=1 Tax=Nostoc sp. C052 TaxID=2576902 RepID=UPI0015C3CF8F|nr:hypothetical protein [Nostoc sp. C052]QLE39982.1 hypothetical protein FD723_05570 [Nostoc sp. C052]
MATIKISDLRPMGSELFFDSESYLTELSDDELAGTQGGSSWACVYGAAVWSSVGCAIGVTVVTLVTAATYGAYQGFRAARR